MAGPGHWISRNLRDMRDTLDLVREMIRELKRGRRGLRFQIHEAIRNFEDSRRMRDELSQLSSNISNYTQTEEMQLQINTNENVLSADYCMDAENENGTLQVSWKINIRINNSAMSTESFHSAAESFGSMASEDNSEENPDTEMESLHSSEEEFNSSIHCADTSENESLDADNDLGSFSQSSELTYSKTEFLEDYLDSTVTMSTTSENYEQHERGDYCSKEDVICMRTNECKKRIISVPKEINAFENLQDEITSNISSAFMTNNNNQYPDAEDFKGKRKGIISSSISSNSNFQNDIFEKPKWSIAAPIESCYNKTVMYENSKPPTRKEPPYTCESIAEINSYTCTNILGNLQNDIIACQTNQKNADDSLKQVEKDKFSFESKSLTYSPTYSQMNYSENSSTYEIFSVKRNISEDSKSSIEENLYCNAESVDEFGINFHQDENLLKNEKMANDCSNSLQIEGLEDSKKIFCESSTSQTMNFSKDTSEESNWCKNGETENSNPFENKDFTEKKINLSIKEEEIDYENETSNCSGINLYVSINTDKAGHESRDKMINVEKMEDEISTPLRTNELDLEKENFNDSWRNSFNEKNSQEHSENHMNKDTNHILTNHFLESQHNLVNHDNETDNYVSNNSWSNFNFLRDYSRNRCNEFIFSVNICNPFERNCEDYFDKNVELQERTNYLSDTYSTNHYNNIQLQSVTSTSSNEDLYPVREDFSLIIEKQGDRGANFFPKTDICEKNYEKAEKMKNLSELSVDEFDITNEIVQTFDGESTLARSLENSGTICVNASQGDTSLKCNAITSSAEDAINLETKATASTDIINENHQPIKNIPTEEKHLLNEDETE